MEYREMKTHEITRIGEVNCEELVEAEYVTKADGSGFGLVIVRTEKSPPFNATSWSF